MFITIFCTELAYFYLLFFMLGIHLFLYYGSGEGGNSREALIGNNIGTWLLFIPPIIFNFYKIFWFSKSKEVEKLTTYVSIQVAFVLFIIYQYICGTYIYFY